MGEVVGRYALFDEVASGGMGAVHLGRRLGAGGGTVAIKRLHAQYANDPSFTTMFMDEARIALRIQHPNVVATHDVVASDRGLLLVMEYVHGESLARLMAAARAQGEAIAPAIAVAIVRGALLGLHAAHETRGASGELLGIVHRDVCPQNILVGVDGVARMLDFGIAKAVGRSQVSVEGEIKGKLAYMAPEQIRGQAERRTDVFAASVVLWEVLAGRRMHEGLDQLEMVRRVVEGNIQPPSAYASAVPPALDALVLRGLAPNAERRFASAAAMAHELEAEVAVAPPREVAAWVERMSGDRLGFRQAKLAAIEREAGALAPPPPPPTPPLLGKEDWLLAARVFATVSALLAVIGASLGAYALLHDEPAPAPEAPDGGGAD